MADIITFSCDGPTTPSIELRLPAVAGQSHASGWGAGWYPEGSHSAIVGKDPHPSATQIAMDKVTDWADFRSTVFLCKVGGANET